MPDVPRTTEPASRTLIAAAATATSAVDDPPAAPTPPAPGEDEFRLRPGESVADGLRRAARGRLAAGSTALAGVTDREELGRAVHTTRKSIKRVRAVLRLSRDAIGAQTYEDENAAMRAIAGRLSGARDARVMIETLCALEERSESELAPESTARLRARLEEDERRELAVLSDDGDLAVASRQALEEARARTAQWRLDADGFDAVKPGLRRVYSRGRKRLRAACDEPSATNLHDVRKRVKDLWHAAELLHEAHPKRMSRLARDAHELSGLLGDHHDLSVLRDYADSNPQLFADMASRELLLGALDRRRDTLRDEALELGRKVYERSPGSFVKRVARGWEKRVAASG